MPERTTKCEIVATLLLLPLQGSRKQNSSRSAQCIGSVVDVESPQQEYRMLQGRRQAAQEL